MNERRLRKEVIDVCARIHQKGWVANHDGNISVRLGDNRLLITPTAMSKGDITEEMLLVVDMTGKKLFGSRKPFSELNLHLAAYRARPEIAAVLHAHPPTATGFAVAGIPLSPPFLPEVVVSLGAEIPTAPFAMPGTPESEAAVADALRHCHVFLLENHGALSVGESIQQAYLRMELVEHYAKINLVALQLGSVQTLSPPQVETLLEKHRKAGLAPPGQAETPPPPCSARSSHPSGVGEDLKEIISREIARVLKA
ncbi:MAG: class II aldolase/adducin family protein [Deltaproteobacteria bacterium]|nr:MAG: class II aldolase/adducin family protein [Deltaproteobacteria bacterium]